jgi:L-amino acid N-acyltransferase YncA
MKKVIRYCRDHGMRRIVGQTMLENEGMRKLAELFQFEARITADHTVHLSLELDSQLSSRQSSGVGVS